MRNLGMLVLALGLGACATGGTSRAQDWRDPYLGSYGTTTYSYGWPRAGDARPEATSEPEREAEPRVAPAALAAQVLAEINRVRADPQAYARRLRAYRAWYHGDVVRAPGDPVGVRTREGVAALDEAITDVEHRRPLRPLRPNARLRAAAARLAEEEGPTGVVGHIGPDGLTPGQRMRDAGVWAGITEENISFGQATAAAVVRQLVIDDGVPDRGHRNSIFERGLTSAGVSCGPHVRWGWMCVLDFAGAMAQR